MRELWQALAGWEIPGLTIEEIGHASGWVVRLSYDGRVARVHRDDSWQEHRAIAMLIVDALEAAGEAYFERRQGGKMIVWSAGVNVQQEVFAESINDHDGNEGATILALLVKVREATDASASGLHKLVEDIINE